MCEKIKVKMTRELEVCENTFFNKSVIPEKQYSIVEVEKGNLFAIVQKSLLGGSHRVVITFKSCEQAFDENYLITTEDSNVMLVKFHNDAMYYTEQFKEVKFYVKIFDYCYALIVREDDSLGLIKITSSDYYDYNYEWEAEYIFALDVINNIGLILTKNMEVILPDESEEFTKFCGFDNFAIIDYRDEEKYAVLRINDKKKSQKFYEIKGTYLPNPNNRDFLRVMINKELKKWAIMRISNFELSSEFDELVSINDEYAIINNEGNEYILRLKDFAMFKQV